MKCKATFCNAPAVPGAEKQYCNHHLAAFRARRQQSLNKPQCMDCGQPTAHVDPEDDTAPMCAACVITRGEQRAAQEIRNTKERTLAEAETVEDLRTWLETYIL